MFFCPLEPRFMAKGMDVWVTDSGSLRVLVENIVVSQLKIVCSGKNVREIWNWYSVVGRTLRERQIETCGRGFRQSGIETTSKATSMAASSESSGVLSWKGELTSLSMIYHGWAQWPQEPAHAFLEHDLSLSVWDAVAMCAITFGGVGESLGAQGSEKGWHSFSAKYF